MRLAMVGAGAISSWHLHGIESCPADIEITAVIDPDSDRAETLATRTAAVPFASLADAAATAEFDAVDIMVPHHLHEQVATEAFAIGKHVLLEKPMAPDLDACKRIQAAADAAGTVFMVGENAQYWPEVVTAADLIDDGAIGDVVTARAAVFFPPLPDFYEGDAPWRLDTARAGGGIAVDTGSHWIRPLRMWLGDIEEVVAVTGRPFPGMEGESLVRALLRFSAGTVASFDALLTSAPLAPEILFRVTGTEGEITIDGAGVTRLYDANDRGGRQVGDTGGYFDSFVGEFDDFAAAVTQGRPPAAPAESSLGELCAAHAMYRSAESKRWEKVQA